MKMLIDSREQIPLDFSGYRIVTDEIILKLNEGDYCVEYTNGYRPPVVFERKSLGDLYGTMTKGYPRFKRELKRASEHGTRVILAVEGSYAKVGKGYKYSHYEGISMRRKLNTMWLRYGLMPIFCKDREEMACRIVDYFEGLGRLKVWDNEEILN